MSTLIFFIVIAVLFIPAFMYWELKKAKRAEFIRDYTLPPGLFEKLRKKHPQLSLKDCQLVGHALRQYFICYLKSDKRNVAMPSQVVDDLWHEFILYTRNYQQFCRQAFGSFMHHTPAIMLSAGPSNNQGLARAWWQACREEDINPRKPTRLPLLFAIDRKLSIASGYFYVLDCSSNTEVAKLATLNGTIHCATTLATMRRPEDNSSSTCGSGCSSTSSSHGCSAAGCTGGCSGGCGGGD